MTHFLIRKTDNLIGYYRIFVRGLFLYHSPETISKELDKNFYSAEEAIEAIKLEMGDLLYKIKVENS